MVDGEEIFEQLNETKELYFDEVNRLAGNIIFELFDEHLSRRIAG